MEYLVNPFSSATLRTTKAGIDNDDEQDDYMMSADEPEYNFDGFTIECNDKVALTPITDKKVKP